MHEYYSSICELHGNPVDGSTLPTVFHSVKHLSTACEVNTVLVFTQMWPEILFPESWND